MEQQRDILSHLEKEIDYKTASVEQRLSNFLIDKFIVTVLFLGIIYYMRNSLGEGSMVICIYIIFYLTYFTVMEGLIGQTIGKMVTNTRVVTQDGAIPSYKHAFGRTLCRAIPFNVFSGLSGKPWHDSITTTRVVSS